MSTERMATFEPYAVSAASAVTLCRDIDATARQVAALTAENRKLRHEKATALAAAECERAESARLRGENQRLSNELATATALRTVGTAP